VICSYCGITKYGNQNKAIGIIENSYIATALIPDSACMFRSIALSYVDVNLAVQ